jgi:hypothetical protein
MEESGARSVLVSVTNGCGSGRPKNITYGSGSTAPEKGIDLSFLGRLGAAKREAGNSMIKYQQIVYPLCIDIQVCFYFLRSVVDL